MEDLARRIQRIDWKQVQRQAVNVRRSTASALKDLVMTDLENKVRAATADTTWGASASDLSLIAQATYNREDYTLIMSILWQRLASSRWRCVLKGLELLKHLVCYGAARVRDEAHAAMYHLRNLENYRYVDKITGRDCGKGVREKARLVCELLRDEEYLEEYKRENDGLREKVHRGGAISSEDYGSVVGGDRRPTLGVSRSGGYREDTDEGTDGGFGGYDDVPGRFGGFGQKEEVTPQKNVDELLGGDEPVLAIESKEAVEKQAAQNGDLMVAENKIEDVGGDLNDILAGLPDAPVTTNATATSSSSFPVQKTEAPSSLGNPMDSLLNGENKPTGLSANTGADSCSEGDKKQEGSTAYGGLVHFDNIMLGKGDRVDPKRPVNQKKSTTSLSPNPFADAQEVTSAASKVVPTPKIQKAKEDPFADLLSTAKKSGGV